MREINHGVKEDEEGKLYRKTRILQEEAVVRTILLPRNK